MSGKPSNFEQSWLNNAGTNGQCGVLTVRTDVRNQRTGESRFVIHRSARVALESIRLDAWRRLHPGRMDATQQTIGMVLLPPIMITKRHSGGFIIVVPIGDHNNAHVENIVHIVYPPLASDGGKSHTPIDITKLVDRYVGMIIQEETQRQAARQRFAQRKHLRPIS